MKSARESAAHMAPARPASRLASPRLASPQLPAAKLAAAELLPTRAAGGEGRSSAEAGSVTGGSEPEASAGQLASPAPARILGGAGSGEP